MQLLLSYVPQVFRETESEIRDFAATLPKEDGKDFSDTTINRVAEYTARSSIEGLLRPLDMQKYIFAQKGRNESTQNARSALFDFEVRPGMVPQFKSWADIARVCGCTRATLSAAAKQLPPALRKRR